MPPSRYRVALVVPVSTVPEEVSLLAVRSHPTDRIEVAIAARRFSPPQLALEAEAKTRRNNVVAWEATLETLLHPRAF